MHPLFAAKSRYISFWTKAAKALVLASFALLASTVCCFANDAAHVLLAQATPATTTEPVQPTASPPPVTTDSVPTPPGTTAAAAAPDSIATTAAPKFDVISMVLHADIVVQCVMGFLVLCSITTWTIFLQKSVVLGRARRSSVAFLKSFRGARTVRDIAQSASGKTVSPVGQMWEAALTEWELFQSRHANGVVTPHQADGLVQRMSMAATISQEQEMVRLSSSMGILATIGSTSPFIGLFGTVWGILTSFVGIAATKATSLSAVAPGIAEALLATAIGLVAAIPAVMIYNSFARRISHMSGMLDNFQGELATIVSRELEVVG
jgi:TolQ protein